jgi:hypothetical protein
VQGRRSDESAPYLHPGSASWPWILDARPSVSDDVLTKDRIGVTFFATFFALF